MNRDDLQTEAITHLQNLIRINTSNPGSNEAEAVRYIAQILDREQIPYQIFEPAPNRLNLIARLKGNQSKKPILLNAHLDVVPAEKEHWKHDPFSGAIEDGCIWGRGAIDMKQMAVMSLMTLIRAKRQNSNLNRDLILACVADEEAGCKWGSRWLVDNKPELLQAEYALNEVGGFSLNLGSAVFYPIGVAEKGLCWFKLTSRGDPGHGSMPHANQALLKMTRHACALKMGALPFHSHRVVHDFINGLAAKQPFPKNWILRGLNFAGLNRFILNNLLPAEKRASFHAMFHNTVSPTMMRAGAKVNVIPSKAELEVDGRILPGETVESFIAEVKRALKGELELELTEHWNPTVTDTDNSFYRLLCDSLQKHDPQAIPLPYLNPGFSDSAHYARLGIKCYGFAPVKLPPDMSFAELFHGHNERIPVEGFLFGLNVLESVVLAA